MSVTRGENTVYSLPLLIDLTCILFFSRKEYKSTRKRKKREGRNKEERKKGERKDGLKVTTFKERHHLYMLIFFPSHTAFHCFNIVKMLVLSIYA